MALSRRKKKLAVPAGSRSTTSGGVARAPQRASSQLAGESKETSWQFRATHLRPAIRRPAPGAWSAPLPAISTVTGEQAAVGSRQIVPPDEGVTYAALLAGAIVPFQPSGAFRPV